MPVTGLETAARDLGRRSMMAMKDGGGGLSGLPPEAFAALSERVRIAEDRLESMATRAELSRAVTRAVALGAVIGAVAGAALAVLVSQLLG